MANYYNDVRRIRTMLINRIRKVGQAESARQCGISEMAISRFVRQESTDSLTTMLKIIYGLGWTIAMMPSGTGDGEAAAMQWPGKAGYQREMIKAFSRGRQADSIERKKREDDPDRGTIWESLKPSKNQKHPKPTKVAESAPEHGPRESTRRAKRSIT